MEFNLSAGLFTAESKFSKFESEKIYDVIIIGGGPAGFTAAVYCMRKGLSTGILVKKVGGQVAETAGIENYLGYRYINGIELVDKFKDQVQQFEIAFEEGPEVSGIEDGEVKKVILRDGRSYFTRSIIIASGKQWRKLNVPGEREFTGRGVAYCSTCDAPFFEDRRVFIVGGGNSAIEAVIDLAKVAEHVTVVLRNDKFKGDSILIDNLKEFSNIDYMHFNDIIEIKGHDIVEGVTLKNSKTGEIIEKETDGVFVEIGLVPNTEFAEGVIEMNSQKEIIVDSSCRTNVKGIFAAGDVTSVPFKQIIIACGEGAKAALAVSEYLNRNE